MHTYTLTSHTLLLQDQEDSSYIFPNEIDVQVKSDDFFALLASKIEALSQEIAAQDTARQHFAEPRLQKIVDDLLYLDQHYHIVKK